jgi:hypothetical protein
MGIRLNLLIPTWPLSICRLDPGKPIPTWALEGPFYSITHSADELSIICDSRAIPKGMKTDNGWRAIQLEGPFDFSLIGIMLSVTTPLAEAGVSILAVSSFDTDYVLVKGINLANAIKALINAGHNVRFLTG